LLLVDCLALEAGEATELLLFDVLLLANVLVGGTIFPFVILVTCRRNSNQNGQR